MTSWKPACSADAATSPTSAPMSSRSAARQAGRSGLDPAEEPGGRLRAHPELDVGGAVAARDDDGTGEQRERLDAARFAPVEDLQALPVDDSAGSGRVAEDAVPLQHVARVAADTEDPALAVLLAGAVTQAAVERSAAPGDEPATQGEHHQPEQGDDDDGGEGVQHDDEAHRARLPAGPVAPTG